MKKHLNIFSVALIILLLPVSVSAANPLVSSFSPADNVDGVAIDTNSLAITFDQSVQGGVGNFVFYNEDSVIVETIAAQGSQVSGSGTATLTIVLSQTLGTKNTGFFVFIDTDAVLNGTNEFYAGISDRTVWNFTTVGGGAGARTTSARIGSSGLGFVEYFSVGTSTQNTLQPTTVSELVTPPEEIVAQEPVLPIAATINESSVPKGYTIPYRFKRRTCARVASRFSASTSVLSRANLRLQKRFGFSCSRTGLPTG